MSSKGRGKRAGSRRGKFSESIFLWVAPKLLYWALRLLVRTVRIEIEGLDAVRERWRRGERVVLTFWHGRQVAVAMALPQIEARPCILVSQHRDGEIATRMLGRWGVATVRGSTTRGAVSGLRGLLRAYRDGHDIALAPDGPRGPCCEAKAGVVHVSKFTGAALVPVGAAADRVWRLGSWDRMVVPKPFSRLLLLVGEPISVPSDIDGEGVEAARLATQAAINRLTDAAEARMREPTS